MPKPVRVHDKVFPTKKAAADTIRGILYRYQPGETLNAADSRFMLGVLALHRHAMQKVGPGVSSFQVERVNFTRCFWLTRSDGTRTDFSYQSCLTHPTPEREAKNAFRCEINDQVLDFRQRHLRPGLTCPILRVQLNEGNVHVDHCAPTFDALISSFLNGRALASIRVNETVDGSTVTTLADVQLAAEWRAYHAANAVLRLVSRDANLRRRR